MDGEGENLNQIIMHHFSCATAVGWGASQLCKSIIFNHVGAFQAVKPLHPTPYTLHIVRSSTE